MRKISSTAFWLAIFGILIAVQAYSTFAQSSDITGSRKSGSVGSIQYQNQVTGVTKPGRGSSFLVQIFAERELRVRRVHGADNVQLHDDAV